jgi:hypothetical protein
VFQNAQRGFFLHPNTEIFSVEKRIHFAVCHNLSLFYVQPKKALWGPYYFKPLIGILGPIFKHNIPYQIMLFCVLLQFQLHLASTIKPPPPVRKTPHRLFLRRAVSCTRGVLPLCPSATIHLYFISLLIFLFFSFRFFPFLSFSLLFFSFFSFLFFPLSPLHLPLGHGGVFVVRNFLLSLVWSDHYSQLKEVHCIFAH